MAAWGRRCAALGSPGLPRGLGGVPRRCGRRTGAAAARAVREHREARDAERGPGPAVPRSGRVQSAGNPYVKHCVRLRGSGRYRQELGRLLLVGDVPVHEVLGAGEARAHVLFRREGTASGLEAGSAHVLDVNEAVLRKLSGLENVDGLSLAAEVAVPAAADFAAWERGTLRRLLVLDRIQDPGNLGTLFRTAAALDWDGVYLVNGCCDPFNEKAIRASRGSPFRLPVAAGGVKGLQEIRAAHDLQCFSAEPRGPGLPEPRELAGANVCLVLGSEGQGVSDECAAFCDPVGIAMTGAMESLNVGVAGGILMHHLQRR